MIQNKETYQYNALFEEYHPFGTTSYRNGRTETEVSLKRYKYVGKERDEETGLYYYGARYYSACLCLFVSVDPLQHKYPHYTPFQYAGNKPISYIDLDGLEPIRPPRASSRNMLNNKRPPSAGRKEYNRYNPISRGNKLNVSYFEKPFSSTDPTYTNNNSMGRGLVAVTKGFSKFVKSFENVKNISYTYTSKGRYKSSITQYYIQFSNPEIEVRFNLMEQNYQSNLEAAISEIPKPTPLGENPTPAEMANYNLESAAYRVSISAVKMELGPSPTEQLVKEIETGGGFESKKTIEEKPVIYETPAGY